MSRDDDALARGKQLFEAGELGPALARLQEIPDESPSRIDALVFIGRIYLAGDQPVLAEECFRTVSGHVRDAYVFYLLGEALLAQGHNSPAEGAFREAMRREPGSASGHLMLGRAVQAQGRIDEAIRMYERAILRDPKLASARYYLTDALLKKGDTLRAVAQLHYLLQLEPNYIPAIILKGDISFRMKDYRQAAAEYERVRDADSASAEVLERLGHAYLAVDDELRALEAYHAATEADPEHWEAFLWAARVAQERKMLKRALLYWTTICDHPDYEEEARPEAERIRNSLANFEVAGGGNVIEEEKPEPLPEPDPSTIPVAPARFSTTQALNMRGGVAFHKGNTGKLNAADSIFPEDDDDDEPQGAGPASATGALLNQGLGILKSFLKQSRPAR
jgi:tetratricopeptide (TPR) repeat protein